ncbi:hypothetical protein OVY29_22790 [Sphingopyxis sp. SE2]|uniref:hypothetical protein n=1 Tax=Sphingopyxis sp. SE2 TaxID=1586240 RepID=UPI0028C08A66|nr:hypothetical protein [Sphingopyxis sp. SE2]MDT7531487.1 hypothetical protein [Sphingopyxis sp. SE2]
MAADDASLTAHIVLEWRAQGQATRIEVAAMLEQRYKIHHTTIQTETEPCKDAAALHA